MAGTLAADEGRSRKKGDDEQGELDPAALRKLLDALSAAADGDFSKRLPARRRGLVGELEGAFNRLAEHSQGQTAEFKRVARQIGREGKMTERARAEDDIRGDYRERIDTLNGLIDDLVRPTTEVARVIVAVAEGDLSQSMAMEIDGQPVKGEFARIGTTVNAMVDQLSSFADEVTRVAREVGTDGKLGGQAEVPGVSGTWADLTESVNSMADNLTGQVRNIAQVTTAVAQGDLSQKITVDARGEILELKDTINTMVDQLGSFADEVTRVAREVGTDGKLGGQAEVRGVSGTWRDLTENVNFMARNLTDQVRGIAQVAGAVAKGDLTQKITVDAKGEVAALADTINAMTDTLSVFAEQVTRVAREVGTEGKLGGQAEVPGVSGTWKDLTESVNSMAENLTGQVRNIALVTTAVAQGDLSQKIEVDARGEILLLKDTINTMVDQLRSFADEVTRVAREVGTEGRLGGQAVVPGVAGTWKDLTDSVNVMARNLTDQVRDIARVTTAVAKGDLTQEVTVDVKGEVLELKRTVNTMVDQLSSFADEVTRVAREVGTEGKLGGQAEVKGVSGTWRDLTENVNFMADNLTHQVRNIAQVTTAVAQGDLSKKITVDARGEILELKDTINTMVDQLRSFASEVTRVAREVGTDGRLGGRAEVEDVSGTWRSLTESVNSMAANLTEQVRGIAQVTTAVGNGDLSKKITVEAKGEVAALAETVNAMVDQLRSFAAEVTRVAREVGTEGKLGGQAQVEGVSGTWRSLTESVNSMADNLTGQVRNIAQVTTAVANGDLSQKITVDARGEILELKDTINTMVDQLGSFADEVTRVAREVGTDGSLGGQAEVEGVRGRWRDLTENVNQLASTLTTQLRAIAEVSTAVTQGDLTRSITVDARGEVAELKDNINQMIANLRETTQINVEQDWLKTNLARMGGMLQGQGDLTQVTRLILSELTPLVTSQHGAFFLVEGDDERSEMRLVAAYGYTPDAAAPERFSLGQGLVGQAAVEGKPIIIEDVPEDYIKVSSGLGEAPPRNIIVLPVIFEDQVLGVIELASLQQISEINRAFLEQITETIGVVLSTIRANMRTEQLLAQSQSLARELQAKNAEIESARAGLEEKATQLALSSKYKSEFLANMSHELRTPLNSLLILSRLLADNGDGNLKPQQVEFATTIHSAGNDLLALINDILDLSKVEAGKMELDLGPVALADVCEDVERSFRPMAKEKGLTFNIRLDDQLPGSIVTDEQRLQQVLRNLLSNAFKFTHNGEVSLAIERDAEEQISFRVDDTGVGIPQDKLASIFESFQQADGTTSRKYGGTGLGLSISREISRLLGGEIRVSSEVGSGSTFALVLPLAHRTGEGLEVSGVSLEPPLAAPAEAPTETAAMLPYDGVEDDRGTIAPGDRVLLVIAHDAGHAQGALAVAREHGLKGLVARRTPLGLALAREYRPDAVLVFAGDGRGERLLAQLKSHPETRHRPVVVAGPAGGRLSALRAGAAAYVDEAGAEGEGGGHAAMAALHALERMSARSVKRLAVVQEGDGLDADTLELLGAGDDVDVLLLAPEGAVQQLRTDGADCAVLVVQPGSKWPLDVLIALECDRAMRELPLVLHVPAPLAAEERVAMEAAASHLVVATAASPDRLIDETALFLHRLETQLPQPTRKLLAKLRTADQVFHGKRVLIVDDDIRNVFALASALETRGMRVAFAENGREGIERLREQPDTDLVLLDVMMPEMDGYETARAIRAMPRFDALPIIQLTAKAMKGDRDKSISAGASDYVTKPVDVEQLLSLMRVWLHR
jgi:HAMP domain-containing protein/signal transduction histidine kinase/CheY-like chemotaxis protein